MRTAPRLVAALAVAVAGAGLLAVPVLATTGYPVEPSPAEVIPPASPSLGQQTATTRKPTVTTRKPTVTTRKAPVTTKKSTVTTKKPVVTTAAKVTTTVATTVPPSAPTLATTVPLPTQSTTLTPVSVVPTTTPAINDLDATRLVNRVVAALVGLAVLVGLLTFVYWRSTKPVPPALDGLDLMSTRKWLRGKSDKRARLLTDFHAKRGPVPDEVIARTSAASVKVGAAVAAPVVVPAMVASGSSLVGLASDDLTDEPPIVVMPEANGTSPSTPSGGSSVTDDDDHDGPAADASFTVVARRPRGKRGGDQVAPT